MPMIDVYAPRSLFPDEVKRELAEQLTLTLLRAEGVTEPTATHLNNTAAFLHFMDSEDVHTAQEGNAQVVRIQVLTPPNVLTRDGQQYLVKAATDLVVRLSGDPTQSERTWVLLTEAADGGWGINGVAYDLPGFAKLLAQ